MSYNFNKSVDQIASDLKKNIHNAEYMKETITGIKKYNHDNLVNIVAKFNDIASDEILVKKLKKYH